MTVSTSIVYDLYSKKREEKNPTKIGCDLKIASQESA
jgi:hypothetical protein